MSHVNAVVGNSASALYEAPTLRKPAVDIGDRQSARLKPDSVIHSAPCAQSIYDAAASPRSSRCANTGWMSDSAPISRKQKSSLKRFPAYPNK
jgi:hypothetical protein